VSKDKKEALVFQYHLAESPANSVPETQRSPLVKLRGLLPDVSYQVEGFKNSFTGAYLMEIGIRFPLKGAYKSRIYKINKQ
jgi:alpha-galactosidase